MIESAHLTSDELDAVLSGTASGRVVSHVATCPACAETVARDRRIIAELALLAEFEPAAGFDDRVMARVTIQRAPVAAVSRTPRSVAARRRAMGVGLVGAGALAAGFIWAGAHPADALSWSLPPLRETGHAAWLWLQTLAANAAEQPGIARLRGALAAPLSGALLVAALAGAYAAALTGLRRLMMEPAADARW